MGWLGDGDWIPTHLMPCAGCHHERTSHYQAGGCSWNFGDAPNQVWCKCEKYQEPELGQVRLV